ncbi:MAG: hypothetical protein MJ177_08610, partial [Clostridia bacterium]|nr:hypothetical protein [Clostridia bacterium]
KILSVILALIMLLLAVPFSAAGAEAESLPIVYLLGQGVEIISADGKLLYCDGRVQIADGYIGDAVKEVLPDFIGAVTLGRWDEYHDSLMSVWEPIYKDIRLDDNGEISNGSYAFCGGGTVVNNPVFDIGSYVIQPDWRLDPFYNAGILDSFIQKVKQREGVSKVNLIARCEGANIAMAYLAIYGYNDINCLELYASAANGVEKVGALFSGDFKLYPDELKTYYYSKKISVGDENVDALLNSAVTWLAETYGFEGACRVLEKIVPKLYEKVIYDVLLTSYGSFPGIWCLVGPQYYATARERIFSGREEQYAGLLQKLDRYDREVRQRNNELLAEAKAAGVKVAVIVKFGEFVTGTPIYRECTYIADSDISVANSSFGATISDTKYVRLSDDYLSKADERYISPCKRIDASTCALPDTTWMVYDCRHNDFNETMNILLKKFFDENGEMDVNTFEEFPQYLTYTGSSLRPMTEEDVQMNFDEQAQKNNSFLARIRRIFTSYLEMLKSALGVVFSRIVF